MSNAALLFFVLTYLFVGALAIRVAIRDARGGWAIFFGGLGAFSLATATGLVALNIIY